MSALSKDHIDQVILEEGKELFRKMKGEAPGVFNKDFWQGRILEWAMQDQDFKIDMFRFVDVLPVLETTEQVSAHIKEYLLKDGRPLPAVMKLALKAASGGLTAGLGAMTIKKNVNEMAKNFIVGDNAKSAVSVLKKLHHQKGGGIAFTVDLLGEATVSEREADNYRNRYHDLIANLPDDVERFKGDDVIDRNHLGPIPRTNVSLKISAMDSQIDPSDPAGSVARLKERVLPLFLLAKKKNVFLNVDLEQWSVHGITYDLFEELLGHPELRSYSHLGIVVQAYLKNSTRDVERLLSLAKHRGAPIGVRLVKGAYWDYETVAARQNGWAPPVFQEKSKTDAQYELLSTALLENIEHFSPAFGSHNLRSVSHALATAKELKVPERSFEIQMLYGMAEPERRVFRSMGHRVRVYAPVGELLPGMAYLVRRLLENTSNDGFLKLTHHDHADERELLKRPTPKVEQDDDARMALVRGDVNSAFDSCPLMDFTSDEERSSFAASVKKEQARFPIVVKPVVANEQVTSSQAQVWLNPSKTAERIAEVHYASVDDAERAVASAKNAFPAWRDASAQERAEKIEALADFLEERRHDLAALMTLEVGKPWSGADGDVAEAIDFCRYYARKAMTELAPSAQGNKEGEDNVLLYEGRGPTVVIAPWNFPLAILCGMASAALVAGNTVVLKPAEQSSAVALALYEAMREVGLGDVVEFLPGDGETIGPLLVNHKDVAQIVFTGSRAVGLSIVEQAAKVQPGQKQLKRVVCEMGGKNAILVDDDADIDEAVLGVVEASFGFAGQKCSACSRVLVHDRIYDSFVKRLVEAVKSLDQGPTSEPAFHFGPVIDDDSHARLMKLIDDVKDDELLFRGPQKEGGRYVPATLIAVSDEVHPWMQQEFFGPLLAVYRVRDFDHGLEVANATEYALTGAVYTRSPARLDQARQEFRVGNLYLNRHCTGALVDRQPFGGFQMSGGGSKAGGPNYLLHFVDPHVVTENTMRRGFTPDLES
ncbi:MAG: bifunctional proline dehydrogenase/L-glutamate gamma-semialdehyde dehydrogenase [Deltaproteobacteria bacterium]|nr:bifunctional proline dehydrogenase/L-glutamate gamma-semialdehyde dehydrogenase [Deltaproteobacteria bacterium]